MSVSIARVGAPIAVAVVVGAAVIEGPAGLTAGCEAAPLAGAVVAVGCAGGGNAGGLGAGGSAASTVSIFSSALTWFRARFRSGLVGSSRASHE